MTNAQFATILDQIISQAFDIACEMPGSKVSRMAHTLAGTASDAIEAIEKELEDAYWDEMARQHEDMLDAMADATSAHWGHD